MSGILGGSSPIDTATDMSKALREFLAKDAADSSGGATAVDGGMGDLSLGELDISTSSGSSLAGLEAQLDFFSEHPVLKAILDQVRCLESKDPGSRVKIGYFFIV